MGATLTTADGFLKEDYEGDVIWEQINSMTPLLTRWNSTVKEVDTVGGKSMQLRFPVKTSRNQAIGARAEGGTLPTASNIGGTQMTSAMKFNYGRIQLTGQAIKTSKRSEVAFVKLLDQEIDGMVEGMHVDFARQIHGDGSGFLCQANGTFNNTTIVTVDGPDTRWLEVGMPVYAFTAKSGGSAGALTNGTISDIDQDNNTITLGVATTVNDNEYLFRLGSRGAEMVGLLAHIDDGTNAATIQGITRATAGNNYSKARLVSAGNASLTEAWLQQAMQTSYTGLFSGGKGATVAICDPQSMRYIAKLLITKERFVDSKKFAGGYSTLTYQVGGKAVEFFEDRFAYPGYIQFVNETAVELAYASDAKFRWMDEDGAILQRVIGQDAYEATMYVYSNLVFHNYGSQVRLYSYAAPA